MDLLKTATQVIPQAKDTVSNPLSNRQTSPCRIIYHCCSRLQGRRTQARCDNHMPSPQEERFVIFIMHRSLLLRLKQL